MWLNRLLIIHLKDNREQLLSETRDRHQQSDLGGLEEDMLPNKIKNLHYRNLLKNGNDQNPKNGNGNARRHWDELHRLRPVNIRYSSMGP